MRFHVTTGARLCFTTQEEDWKCTRTNIHNRGPPKALETSLPISLSSPCSPVSAGLLLSDYHHPHAPHCPIAAQDSCLAFSTASSPQFPESLLHFYNWSKFGSSYNTWWQELSSSIVLRFVFKWKIQRTMSSKYGGGKLMHPSQCHCFKVQKKCLRLSVLRF